jgi:hypothetical protein
MQVCGEGLLTRSGPAILLDWCLTTLRGTAP